MWKGKKYKYLNILGTKKAYIVLTYHYHYVQNQEKLMMQSRDNGEKPQFGQFFFDGFEVKYLEIANFSKKIGFIQIEGHI